MEGRVLQEEVATRRHVFITLVTDTIPPLLILLLSLGSENCFHAYLCDISGICPNKGLGRSILA